LASPKGQKGRKEAACMRERRGKRIESHTVTVRVGEKEKSDAEHEQDDCRRRKGKGYCRVTKRGRRPSRNAPWRNGKTGESRYADH